MTENGHETNDAINGLINGDGITSHGYIVDDSKNIDNEGLISGNINDKLIKYDVKYDGLKELPVYRSTFFITISVFMGYASLVVVQHKLYDQYKLNHNGYLSNEEKSLFEHGTSLIYVGNLLFRLLHNLVFGMFTPRNRVIISLLSITISMLLLSFVYFVINSQNVAWVYVCYLIGGMGVGSFEANLLSTITPLGPDTKVWALGITFIILYISYQYVICTLIYVHIY